MAMDKTFKKSEHDIIDIFKTCIYCVLILVRIVIQY